VVSIQRLLELRRLQKKKPSRNEQSDSISVWGSRWNWRFSVVRKCCIPTSNDKQAGSRGFLRSAAENFGRVVTQASSIRVIIFDNKTKKAWMVPAVVALLFSSLCLIEKENFMRFEDKSGNAVFFTYASKSHNAEESAAEALESNRDIFMRRLESYRREAFSDLIKAIWYDMTRGENICRNESTGQLVYEKNRVFGYDLSEAILGKAIHLRGFKADGATANWATLTKEIPVIFVADVGRVIQTRLPNGPGRLASFGAPNDGPVRGMHFGGLVRPSTESEYLRPDIDDCSFRIRF